MNYSAVVEELLDPPGLDSLGVGTPHQSVYRELKELTEDKLASNVVDRQMAACCLSGLWLYHNFLDESHRISQAIHTAEGSFWHGIMHRREGDFSNSKYWFHKTGQHETFSSLSEQAQAIAEEHGQDLGFISPWDPDGWIDFCSGVSRGSDAARQTALALQRAEWWTLFDYCYERAVGG